MKSKYEEYTQEQRLADLENVVRIQKDCTDGTDPYMTGMMNGLLIAWNIIAEPYGTTVLFVDNKPIDLVNLKDPEMPPCFSGPPCANPYCGCKS